MLFGISFLTSKHHAPLNSSSATAEVASPYVDEVELHIESSSELFSSHSPFPTNAANQIPPPLPVALSPFIDHVVEMAKTSILPTKFDSRPPKKRAAKGLSALAVHQSSVEARHSTVA